jgi:broad specificity phosphatase PhoE
MEISLIRHGKSQLTENSKITCPELKQWVKKYDDLGIIEKATYPTETVNKVINAKIVVTSDLKRSIQSAQLLSQGVKIISDPVFRETELPSTSKKFFNLKLRPTMWLIILRLLWIFGHSNDCESLKNAKYRAKIASHQLIDYAEGNKSVALVGHGFFNSLIAKELQKRGWKGKRKTGSKHWNCSTYSFSE